METEEEEDREEGGKSNNLSAVLMKGQVQKGEGLRGG